MNYIWDGSIEVDMLIFLVLCLVRQTDDMNKKAAVLMQ